MQSSGKKEVGVANVLIAIFSEKQSHAVHLLNRAEVTRLDVVNFVSHGLSKIAEEKTAKEDTAEGERGEEGGSALDKYTTNLNQLAQDGKIDPLIGRQLEVETDHRDPVPPSQEQSGCTWAKPAWARPPLPRAFRA